MHDGAQLSKHRLGTGIKLSFHSPPIVTGFCVVWRFKVQGQKACFEEHTEYVALEVNLSKSGWPTMYETLQVVLLHVFFFFFFFFFFCL